MTRIHGSLFILNVLFSGHFDSFLSLFVFVDRRAFRQSDSESHEKLAQRIEKDVVSAFLYPQGHLLICYAAPFTSHVATFFKA